MNNFTNRILALFFLILSFPLWPILYLAVRLDSSGPFLFKQKRIGKDGTTFTFYKIRTMVENAESLKTKYQHLNEAGEPVFKIRNDPRYTKVGKFLSHAGLDELPQLLNVLKGEMSLVGPRPLPVSEAISVPRKYMKRLAVLPGMTSSWVIKGAHRIGFKKWMELDLDDVKNKSLKYDLQILFLTALLVFKKTMGKHRRGEIAE